jgi:hypothetical protein
VTMTAERQLTLDIGGDHRAPSISSWSVSGKIANQRELEQGSEVLVQIIDADGEIISSAHGRVKFVGFDEHEPKDGPAFLERIHRVSI